MAESSNHSGGIPGGAGGGNDTVIRAAFRPTLPTARGWHTVIRTGQELDIEIKEHHDPIIVSRAVVVMEVTAALAAVDLLLMSMTSRLGWTQGFFGRG